MTWLISQAYSFLGQYLSVLISLSRGACPEMLFRYLGSQAFISRFLMWLAMIYRILSALLWHQRRSVV